MVENKSFCGRSRKLRFGSAACLRLAKSFGKPLACWTYHAESANSNQSGNGITPTFGFARQTELLGLLCVRCAL